MKRYIFLNQKYYSISFRLKSQIKAARKIYFSGNIIPISTITSIDRTAAEQLNICTEMRALEERYCDLFPIDVVMNMINNGATLKI